MKLKILTTKELRALKASDTAKYLADLESAYAKLVHAISTGTSKTTHQLSVLKRAIAQVHTINQETALSGKEK